MSTDEAEASEETGRWTFTIDISEAEFQRKVVTVAEEFGWEWMHIGRVGKHIANGAKGTLGPGWPDLLMVRGRRMICAELKAEKAPGVSIHQQQVLERLSEAAEVHVWRPSQWNLIREVLR